MLLVGYLGQQWNGARSANCSVRLLNSFWPSFIFIVSIGVLNLRHSTIHVDFANSTPRTIIIPSFLIQETLRSEEYSMVLYHTRFCRVTPSKKEAATATYRSTRAHLVSKVSNKIKEKEQDTMGLCYILFERLHDVGGRRMVSTPSMLGRRTNNHDVAQYQNVSPRDNNIMV